MYDWVSDVTANVRSQTAISDDPYAWLHKNTSSVLLLIVTRLLSGEATEAVRPAGPSDSNWQCVSPTNDQYHVLMSKLLNLTILVFSLRHSMCTTL